TLNGFSRSTCSRSATRSSASAISRFVIAATGSLRANLPRPGPSRNGSHQETRDMNELAADTAGRVWQWRRAASDDRGARPAAAARRKGALGGGIGLLVAGALAFWRPGAAVVVAAIAIATALLALVSPLGGFRRLTLVLDAFGRVVGLATTWVLMVLAFYLLF